MASNKPYDPTKCSGWTATFLAAECRRYGVLTGLTQDQQVAVWMDEQETVCSLLDYWLDERTKQQEAIFGPIVRSPVHDSSEPQSYEAIKLAVMLRDLRVSSRFCETAPWGEDLNIRLRGVHDVDHVLQEFTLSVDDEVRLACLHASMLFQYALVRGYNKSTAAYAALCLLIDTGGQAFYAHLTEGGFVPDQTAYLLTCLEHGVLTGSREYLAEVST